MPRHGYMLFHGHLCLKNHTLLAMVQLLRPHTLAQLSRIEDLHPTHLSKTWAHAL